MLFKCNIFARLYCQTLYEINANSNPLSVDIFIEICYVVVYARFIDNYSEGYSTIGLIVTESD